MHIHIRTANMEDCERIRPLQKEIAELHHAGRPDVFKTVARYLTDEVFSARLNDPNHTIFIAETEDGEVAGYVFAWILFYRDHPVYKDHDCFYIDDICVLKAYQRNGIGRMLFEACKEKARQRECTTIELGVWSFNRDAIAFYESCGMTERSRRMEYKLEG